MKILCILLAVMSLWDYPSRKVQHDNLRHRFIIAVKEGDTSAMEELSRKGVELLPDDPTWRYNLACSLAWFDGRENEALDTLEKAIELGYRNAKAIKNDTDLARISGNPRFSALVKKAASLSFVPLENGPLAAEDATGIAGTKITLGEKNLTWDFDAGCFEAHLKLAPGNLGKNMGDLYMNRDAGHSRPRLAEFPGITEVKFDAEGVRREMHTGIPNVYFPYPLFGNCSQAFVKGRAWRSMPRAILSAYLPDLKAMQKLYLSNQIWFFPSNLDTPPLGQYGDVFHANVPFWVTTAGRSWSDIPYLRAAMLCSRSFAPATKASAVSRRLFAPTVITLLKKSLIGVTSEEDYISPKAHPTALPPSGVDTNRLVQLSAQMTPESIPPLVTVTAESVSDITDVGIPELLYSTPYAVSYVIRAPERKRVFVLKASGAQKMCFVKTMGSYSAAKVVPIGGNGAVVELNTSRLNPTSRVDIAVFGRNQQTGWGAPSFVSFTKTSKSAPYSDPFLTLKGLVTK